MRLFGRPRFEAKPLRALAKSRIRSASEINRLYFA
jgi:hypothetical protein